MAETDTPELIAPPIVEVVCGVKFKPIMPFDALRHGLYWSGIHQRYPRAEVHPPVIEPGSRVVADVPLQRTWFVSADDEYVVQVQFDRFMFNWRRREGAYPGFGAPELGGVCGRFFEEFRNFAGFMRGALGFALEVEALELSKVDVLEHGRHWVDDDDLVRMVPRLRSVIGPGPAEGQNLTVATMANVDGGALHTGLRLVPDGPRVQVEFRLRATPTEGDTLERGFLQANERLNAAFFAELPDAATRFGTEVQ